MVIRFKQYEPDIRADGAARFTQFTRYIADSDNHSRLGVLREVMEDAGLGDDYNELVGIGGPDRRVNATGTETKATAATSSSSSTSPRRGRTAGEDQKSTHSHHHARQQQQQQQQSSSLSSSSPSSSSSPKSPSRRFLRPLPSSSSSSPPSLSLSVHVKPNAKQTEILSLDDAEELECRVAAPPRDGEANAEIVRFMTQVLGGKKRTVSLDKGHRSRSKVLLIVGVDEQYVLTCLEKACTRMKGK